MKKIIFSVFLFLFYWSFFSQTDKQKKCAPTPSYTEKHEVPTLSKDNKLPDASFSSSNSESTNKPSTPEKLPQAAFCAPAVEAMKKENKPNHPKE